MPFASANVSSASNIQYIQDVIEGAVYAQFGGEYDEIIFKVNTKNQYKKCIIVFSFVGELAQTIRCATITLTIKDNKIININKSVRINDKKHKNDETIIKKINEMINQMANMMKINLTVVAIPGFNDSESNHFDIKELSIVPESISDTVKTVEKFIFDSCTSLIAMSNRMCAEINQIISPHIRRAEQHERINSVPVVSAAAEVSIVNDTNNFPAMNTRPRVNSPLLSNMELIYTSPHQPQRHNVISPIPVVNVSNNNNNNNNDTTQHFERKLEFLMNKAQEHARNLDETNNEIENVKRDFSKFKMYQQRRQREELERLEKEQEDELKKITEKFAERKKLLLESNSNNDGVSVTTQPVATFATIVRETTPLMVQSATVHINEFVQQHIINPIQQTNSDVIIAKTVVIPVAEPIAVVSESVAVVSESVAVVSESVAVLVTSIPDVIEPVPTEITLYDEIAVIAEIVAEAEAETEEFIANTKPAVIETDEKTVLWGDSEQDELPPVIETKTTTMTSAIKSTTKPTQSNWIKCDNRQGNKRGKK